LINNGVQGHSNVTVFGTGRKRVSTETLAMS